MNPREFWEWERGKGKGRGREKGRREAKRRRKVKEGENNSYFFPCFPLVMMIIAIITLIFRTIGKLLNYNVLI